MLFARLPAIASVCEPEKGSATAVHGAAAGLTYTNKQTEPSRGEAHGSPATTSRQEKTSSLPLSTVAAEQQERVASEILQG